VRILNIPIQIWILIKKMDLDAISTILVGDPFLTSSYTPNTIPDSVATAQLQNRKPIKPS
jgi:hypothetical protein